MNRELASWFRGGVEQRMQPLADAEERLTAETRQIVLDPTPGKLAATTVAAQELLAATDDGLNWLRLHPCAVSHVGASLQTAFDQFHLAAETLINMSNG